MEEEIREQPTEEQAEVLHKTEESVDSEVGSQFVGKFGKFKSAEALFDAYNSLQAEFTRKCQKLSEFEKEKTEESKLSQQEIDEGLSKFLSKNSDAEDYSDEIKTMVNSEQTGDPFETAWAKIVLKKFVDNQQNKSEDPFLRKYIFDDEEFKNKVIESYMKDLNFNKPPILLSSESGQRAARLDPAPPTSLQEAKKLVEDMFS